MSETAEPVVLSEIDTTPRKVYIAGPMRGKKDFNFPAFNDAKERGEALGFVVISPADLDRAQDGEKAAISELPNWGGSIAGNVKKYVMRDVNVLLSFTPEKDAIALLPGWERSVGARAEASVAQWLKLDILDARTFQPFNRVEQIQAAFGEKREAAGEGERIATSTTGGSKGVKLRRFSLIPVPFLDELAEVYGKGAEKYSDRNWEKGYPWTWSMDALERHWSDWKKGATRDGETGVSLLAQVAWHAATLYMFQRFGVGNDDRGLGTVK